MSDPIAALRSLFVERCRNDLRELRALREPEDTEQLSIIAHRLAGAAGSFGFPDISAAALVVDQKLQDGLPVSTQDMDRLLGLLRQITDSSQAEAFPERRAGENL